MFKARIRMEVLRELVEVISTLVSEVKLSVSKDGIEVKAVDPSHVAMLVLKLNKNGFEEFTGEPTELGVDVEKLKEVLRLSKPGDILDLQYDGGKNRLVLKVGKLTRHMAQVVHRHAPGGRRREDGRPAPGDPRLGEHLRPRDAHPGGGRVHDVLRGGDRPGRPQAPEGRARQARGQGDG